MFRVVVSLSRPAKISSLIDSGSLASRLAKESSTWRRIERCWQGCEFESQLCQGRFSAAGGALKADGVAEPLF